MSNQTSHLYEGEPKGEPGPGKIAGWGFATKYTVLLFLCPQIIVVPLMFFRVRNWGGGRDALGPGEISQASEK